MKRTILLCLVMAATVGGLAALEKVTQPSEEFPKLRFTGFARVRYTADLTAKKPDGFTIATARFGLTGEISKYFSYSFSLEGTSGDPENKKMIYDVYIDTSLIKNVRLRGGQFKYAFGLEQSTADADLELVNKSDVVNNLIKPTRDMGVQASTDLTFLKPGSSVTVGFYNGSGSNLDDENGKKMWVGRLLMVPLNGVTLGGSYYAGQVGTNADKKTRAGAELKWEWQRWVVKAEYVYGDDMVKGVKVKKDGYYVMAGFTFMPSTVALLRYDRYNANQAVSNQVISRWTAGVNYFFDKRVLLRLNYEHRIETPGVKNDQVSAQIQIKY